MSQKCYVGNLSYNTVTEKISELFSSFGEIISANIIFDRFTNQSKGFAFVEMADEAAANAAIAGLDGTEVDGRNIKVSIAEDKPRNARPRYNNNNRY